MTLIRYAQKHKPRHLTKLAFKQRLLASERIAIRAAAKTDPFVEDFLDLLNDATFVDLDRQENIDGLNYLEAKSFLDDGRAAEILNTPIKDLERP